MNLIKMSAKLNFRMVHENNAQLVSGITPENEKNFVPPFGYELMKTSEFRPGQAPLVTYYVVEKMPKMTGKDIVSAHANKDQFGQRMIMLAYNSRDAAQFAEVTRENIGRSMAIVLDGQLYCAPRINDAITGGSAQITGREGSAARDAAAGPADSTAAAAKSTQPRQSLDRFRFPVMASAPAAWAPETDKNTSSSCRCRSCGFCPPFCLCTFPRPRRR